MYMYMAMAASEYTTFKIGMALCPYYLQAVIIISIIGFIRNFLSLAVILRTHNRPISYCVYMAALAVTDSCSLLAGVYYWCCTGALPPVGRLMVEYVNTMATFSYATLNHINNKQDIEAELIHN